MLAHLKILTSISVWQNIDIDKAIMKNIDINKEILENIDKEILENIDIDKILNRLEFDISNRATPVSNLFNFRIRTLLVTLSSFSFVSP